MREPPGGEIFRLAGSGVKRIAVADPLRHLVRLLEQHRQADAAEIVACEEYVLRQRERAGREPLERDGVVREADRPALRIPRDRRNRAPVELLAIAVHHLEKRRVVEIEDRPILRSGVDPALRVSLAAVREDVRVEEDPERAHSFAAGEKDAESRDRVLVRRIKRRDPDERHELDRCEGLGRLGRSTAQQPRRIVDRGRQHDGSLGNLADARAGADRPPQRLDLRRESRRELREPFRRRDEAAFRRLRRFLALTEDQARAHLRGISRIHALERRAENEMRRGRSEHAASPRFDGLAAAWPEAPREDARAEARGEAGGLARAEGPLVRLAAEQIAFPALLLGVDPREIEIGEERLEPAGVADAARGRLDEAVRRAERVDEPAEARLLFDERHLGRRRARGSTRSRDRRTHRRRS